MVDSGRKPWTERVTTCRHGHTYPPDTPHGADGRRLCMTCRAEGRGKPGRAMTPLAERLWRRVQVGGPNDCWLWLGSTNGNGYGTIGTGGRAGRQTYVHRVAWELAHGPIPPALEVDHLCDTRGCVNVAHMQVVTHTENNRRSTSPAAANSRKTHCPAGHPYDAANTYRPPSAPDSRMCRACMKIREAKRRRTLA